jgi:hypothetical protein
LAGAKRAGDVTVALPVGPVALWVQEIASAAAIPAVTPLKRMLSNLVIKAVLRVTLIEHARRSTRT